MTTSAQLIEPRCRLIPDAAYAALVEQGYLILTVAGRFVTAVDKGDRYVLLEYVAGRFLVCRYL